MIMAEQDNVAKTDDERVRDHLANERTYLAWIRTGVAAMGLGVVIAKLKYILGPAYPRTSGVVHAANIGLLFALIGLATIAIAVYFFLRVRSQIRTRSYQARSDFVIILAALMISLGLVILYYLVQPTT